MLFVVQFAFEGCLPNIFWLYCFLVSQCWIGIFWRCRPNDWLFMLSATSNCRYRSSSVVRILNFGAEGNFDWLDYCVSALSLWTLCPWSFLLSSVGVFNRADSIPVDRSLFIDGFCLSILNSCESVFYFLENSLFAFFSSLTSGTENFLSLYFKVIFLSCGMLLPLMRKFCCCWLFCKCIWLYSFICYIYLI